MCNGICRFTSGATPADLFRLVLFLQLSYMKLCYHPQRNCEGYVFTGVCLSTGGLVSQHALQQVSRGQCYPSMDCRWYPSMPCCVPALGGSALGGVWSRGVWRPPPQKPMATVADGMHPTGMHSCFTISFTAIARILSKLLNRVKHRPHCNSIIHYTKYFPTNKNLVNIRRYHHHQHK